MKETRIAVTNKSMPTDTAECSSASDPSVQKSSSTTHRRSPTPPIPIRHTQTTASIRSNSPSEVSAKQLDKLKRFLSTLYHFGSDLSDEIGDRVRALILALVNDALSVEEFHGKLQGTTNFPLRPFAVPFLKSTLPLLQKEISTLAVRSKQSTSQFIAQHEELIFLARDTLEQESSPPDEQRKRKLSHDSLEAEERHYATKRASIHSSPHQRDKERAFSSYVREFTTDFKEHDNDWKNAEQMLNSILEMVTKSRRVLFTLQQRDTHSRRLIETNDLEWRRRYADLLIQTDNRIADVRRNAEETVFEVKRHSLVDLQKAVAQAEQKSNEILLREREQYQRLKAQTYEEATALLNRQEEGPEQCWHCARKAHETCSACNTARYCGQYCQHRDWEAHQKVCGPDLKRKGKDDSQCFLRSIPNTTAIHRSIVARSPTLSLSMPVESTTHSSTETAEIKKEDEDV